MDIIALIAAPFKPYLGIKYMFNKILIITAEKINLPKILPLYVINKYM